MSAASCRASGRPGGSTARPRAPSTPVKRRDARWLTRIQSRRLVVMRARMRGFRDLAGQPPARTLRRWRPGARGGADSPPRDDPAARPRARRAEREAQPHAAPAAPPAHAGIASRHDARTRRRGRRGRARSARTRPSRCPRPPARRRYRPPRRDAPRKSRAGRPPRSRSTRRSKYALSCSAVRPTPLEPGFRFRRRDQVARVAELGEQFVGGLAGLFARRLGMRRAGEPFPQGASNGAQSPRSMAASTTSSQRSSRVPTVNARRAKSSAKERPENSMGGPQCGVRTVQSPDPRRGAAPLRIRVRLAR